MDNIKYDINDYKKDKELDLESLPVGYIRQVVYNLLDKELKIDKFEIRWDTEEYFEDLSSGLVEELKDIYDILNHPFDKVLTDPFSEDKFGYIYLASPFFTFRERVTVCYLEYILDYLGYRVYSPSRDGEVLNTKTDSIELRQKVFSDNVVGVRDSELVLAVVDNKDAGTFFEIGTKYAYEHSTWSDNKVKRANIITYSDEDYGVNLMILNSSKGHYTTILDLIAGLSNWKIGRDPSERRMSDYEVI